MSDSDAACAVAEQGLGIALVSLPFAVPYLQGLDIKPVAK